MRMALLTDATMSVALGASSSSVNDFMKSSSLSSRLGYVVNNLTLEKFGPACCAKKIRKFVFYRSKSEQQKLKDHEDFRHNFTTYNRCTNESLLTSLLHCASLRPVQTDQTCYSNIIQQCWISVTRPMILITRSKMLDGVG